MKKGILYVVATPIGNLEDLSPRAARVLQEVALVAAEDTRHSRKLFDHFDIRTPLTAVHDHNEAERVQQLVERLQHGDSIALISDAGTPLVSDPGYRLVRAAHQAGLEVCPVPGACAAIAALSAAGLPSDRFCFEGFLPAKSSGRRERLSALAAESRTLMFYEAPHRLAETVADLLAIFGGEREVALARELTKAFETVWAGTLAGLAARLTQDPGQCRGEIVLVVAGAAAAAPTGDEAAARQLLQVLLEEGLAVKQAAHIGARLTGWPRKQLYDWAVILKQGGLPEAE